MDCPCNATELCMYIGCINYYHDIWLSCEHTLNLLMDQSGLKKKVPINWTGNMQKGLTKCVCL
jgi:hypothetical protein